MEYFFDSFQFHEFFGGGLFLEYFFKRKMKNPYLIDIWAKELFALELNIGDVTGLGTINADFAT